MRWIAVFAGPMALPAAADEPQVVAVSARPMAGGAWSFEVTVRHADEGWQHYADRWQVVATDGTVLGERVLLHPHVAEQPFTRSLEGVAVPAGTDEVTVRAHDKVHGWGPACEVTLPQPSSRTPGDAQFCWRAAESR